MKMKYEDGEDFFVEFFKGKHNFPAKIKPWGEGWCINSRYGLATYDFDGLTRLVLMAHEKCVRVELRSAGLHGIKIIIHQRQRKGSLFESHPTIQEVLNSIGKLVEPATQNDIEEKLKKYEELVISNCKAWFEHKMTFGEMSDNLSGYKSEITESLVGKMGKPLTDNK